MVRLLMGCALAVVVSVPAQAQIFWQSPDFAGAPLVPGELGMGVPLPGATVAEERANWAWQMRSGLNVAALQCGFDKTLLMADSYNGVLRNHSGELGSAYTTLRGYFTRVNRNPKEAQNALDKYGTKIYSSFSAVGSQYGFCNTASRIGKRAQFAARGSFTLFAAERLREMRNSLIPAGDQYFRRSRLPFSLAAPRFEARCFDKRGEYRMSCGMLYS